MIYQRYFSAIYIVIVTLLLFFFPDVQGFYENYIKEIETDNSIKVMTYNIQHGRGMDGEVNIERIAQVILDEGADIVALQEVDVGVERSGRTDIASELSELTGLEYNVFGKNLDHQGGDYGNATLSRFPIVEYENIHFEQMGPEKRGILTTLIEIGEFNLLMLNTHLDHRGDDDSERVLYIQGARDKIIPGYEKDGTIFVGDMNDVPGSNTYAVLADFLTDAWMVSGDGEGLTIPADNPLRRIDYIFYSGLLSSTLIWVPETYASDHLPVVSEFELHLNREHK